MYLPLDDDVEPQLVEGELNIVQDLIHDYDLLLVHHLALIGNVAEEALDAKGCSVVELHWSAVCELVSVDDAVLVGEILAQEEAN